MSITVDRASLPSEPEIAEARARLSSFVIAAAKQTADDIGLSWIGYPIQRPSLRSIYYATVNCLVTGAPMLVPEAGSRRTIYTSPGAALAARFWSAINHMRRSHDDSIRAQLDLGKYLTDVGSVSGLPELALRMLEADQVGQVHLRAALGRGPVDERAFVLDVITYELADAILLDAERSEARAA